MEIKVIDEGKPYVIALEGRLDTNTSPELDEFAKGLYEKNVNDIAVDMEKCAFVSSAGLRVIVAMQKHAAADGNLVFRNVQSEVMEVFEMTGFDNILTFE
ncbi:MAG: STAS domain-containing protein [Eggerthellaceae bacterium]|jgi:anti-anti-sigma factor|nr:STAS domain-containing protein [Eggerthellaceae bacterium]